MVKGSIEVGRWVQWVALSLGAAASACTPAARALPPVPDQPATAPDHDGKPTLGWSYQGDLGPAHWGSLRPEWSACDGPGQSPIDLPLDSLTAESPSEPASVSLDLPPSLLTLRVDGQAVTLVGKSELTLVVSGAPSKVQHIEVHVPAEHSLAGATFDAELVFVALAADGRPVLLSLLYRVGAANPAWEPFLEQFPPARVAGEYELSRPVDLAGFAPISAPVLAYDGSLSVPPCTPGAQRLVVAQVGELSSAQIAQLRQAVPRSARPPTPRGERPVTARMLSSVKSNSPATEAKTP